MRTLTPFPQTTNGSNRSIVSRFSMVAALVLALLVISGSFALAFLAPPPREHLTPQKRPTIAPPEEPAEPVIRRDVPYGDGAFERMDLFYEETSQPAVRRPTVVLVGDSGWGRLRTEPGPLASALVRSGFLVASANYDSDQTFPGQLVDLRTAVRFLRSSAATLGVDADRIGVVGKGRGGYFTALLATADDTSGIGVGKEAAVSSRIAAAVDIGGATDLAALSSDTTSTLAKTYMPLFPATRVTAATWEARSPVSHVTTDDPPFLLLQDTASQKALPGQMMRLRSRLASANVDATVVTMDTLTPIEETDTARLVRCIKSFLLETLAGIAPDEADQSEDATSSIGATGTLPRGQPSTAAQPAR
jgi:acetyl esterase/lipase